MDHTMFVPAPNDWRSLVGVYHLKITYFYYWEGMDQGVHMEYDEDTATVQPDKL